MSMQDKRVQWSALPVTMPDGQLMPHMSARARTAMVDAVFQGAGGFERMLAWVEKSDENYGEFLTKIWAKGAAKVSSTELNVSGGVEDLLAKLDAGEHARVVGESD
jgi:hypothetical protein